MYKSVFVATALAIALSGCANTGAKYIPVVDRPNEAFAQDLKECQKLAEQRSDAVTAVLTGAAVGAFLGGAIMHLVVGSGGGEGAALGAISGATQMGLNAEMKQRRIVVQCLSGRGHSIME